MDLPTFENINGEGIVSFLFSWADVRWYHYILVNGEQIFEFCNPCGTCGIVFRKAGSYENRVSDPEAVQLLGDLNQVPSDQTLQRLARVLEPGTYHPIVVEGTIQYIEPGSPNDYFATDVVQLFGLEPPENKEPYGPWTPYYRFGSENDELMGSGKYTYMSLVTAIVMPLHDPSRLNRERVEYWKQQHENGIPLTAFAISVVDHQVPEDEIFGSDPNYKYRGQTLFTNCLLDGHHRIQAAAELGTNARILTFVKKIYSPVQSEDDLKRVLGMYAR